MIPLALDTLDADRKATIRRLNDRLRQRHEGGRVMLTAGVRGLGLQRMRQALAAVAAFDSFDQGNDPHGEHDFVAVEVAGQRVLFKIDAYDLTLTRGSPDPADPTVTERVITIMLASEY